MFVGHYAAALAAKAYEPKAPLWTYVVMGVEKVRIDPTLPVSDLDLYSMPYTHSLPAALIWSAGAAVAALGFRLPWRAALVIALTVFSHWVGDFLVHRPDLVVWFGRPKVGLGLWNLPLPEMALELGLVAMAGAAWVAQRKTEGRHAWPAEKAGAYGAYSPGVAPITVWKGFPRVHYSGLELLKGDPAP